MGRLEKQQLAWLNLHLKECSVCFKKAASIEELLSILFSSLQPVAPDPELRVYILRKIREPTTAS